MNTPLTKRLIPLLSLMLVACSEQQSATPAGSADRVVQQGPLVIKPWYGLEQVGAGARVFREHCASCHGKVGEGAANWRRAGPDGKYPAPPLNGSGHAWHHPLSILFHTIKNGSPGGQGDMPAWADKLTDEEIVAVIAWFQSRWPPEIYQNWLQRDAAARANRG